MVSVGSRNAMANNTGIVLGDYFEQFISSQIASGRYGSDGEVREAIIEGERSHFVVLDMHEIKRKARRRAKPRD
jgi:Arc/MetJ-type ribon-helix-helix transcriptional regulator